MRKTRKMLLFLTLVILLAGIASASEVSEDTTGTLDTCDMKAADNIQEVSQTNTVTDDKSLDNNKIQSTVEYNKTLDKNVNRKNTKEATASDWNSLSSAITAARQASTDTTITLEDGTYTTTGTITWNNPNIVLTIDGNGQTIDGNGRRVLNINSGCSIVLKNIIIENAQSDFGGVISNKGGILTVINSTLQYNNATRFGGAIYNDMKGTLIVSNSSLQYNNAEFGGAIRNDDGSVTVTDSTLQNNTVKYYAGAIQIQKGTLTVTNSTLQNNNAMYGGAIYNEKGTVTVTDSTLQNNTVNYIAGAIYNELDGTLTVTNSTLQNNYGNNYGGAIYSMGNLTVTDSTLQNNTAKTGGAIYNLCIPDYGEFGEEESGIDSVTFTGNVFRDNHADNKETIDLDGFTDGEFSGNTYESTDINLTEIKLSLKDDKDTFNYGVDVILNYSMQLANPSNYKDFEDGINDITLYINGEKNLTTKYGDTVLSNLEPGEYSVYFTSCNQQSNNVTFTVLSAPITNWEQLVTAVYNAGDETEDVNLTLEEGSYISNSTIGWINPNIVLTIDGNGQTIDGNEQIVFYIQSGCSVVLKNIIIKNAQTDNGVIFNEGNLTIINTTLENNTASYGAAIHNLNGTVTVINSTLENNTAELYGGVINNNMGNVTVTDSTLENNNAIKGGGAINNYYGSVTVTDSALEYNIATVGGAINNEYGSVSVTDSALENNNATSNGGVINNYDGTLTVTDSVLQNNYASQDGGVIYSYNASVTVTNSTLQNNSAAQGGGAIYVIEGGSVIVTDSTLENNSAITGGAIVNGGTFTVSNCTIRNNRADDDGGVIYSWDTVTVTDSTLENNEANIGGTIFNWGTVIVTDSTLENNKANNGGAIFNGGVVNVTDSTLENNTANEHGGAITNNGTLTVTNITIEKSNANDHGGAIFNGGTLSVSDSTLQNNTAYRGGAVYNNGTLTLSDSTLQNNNVTRYGGALYNNHAIMTLDNTTLNNNTAINGGGIYNNYANMTLNNTRLISNTATEYGGAIDNNYSNVTLTNNTLFNNNAEYGGVMFNENGDATITNSTIENNSATEDGRIIYSKNGTVTFMDNVVVDPSDSVISTPESSYRYIKGVDNKIPLIIVDFSKLQGTINVTVKNQDEYKQLLSIDNVENGYELSTEVVASALEKIYGTLNLSYTINCTYSSDATVPSSTEFILNVLHNTTITFDEISDAKFNENVTISGTLVSDSIGLNQNLTLIIGESQVNVTAEDGVFEYTTVFKEVGEKTVIAKYDGNDNYLASNATTSFNIEKQDIIITYDSIKDTVYSENVTITGNFTEENGKAISNSNVNVYINGKQYKARTDQTGAFTLIAPVKAVGTNNVTLSYGGNAYYNSFETNATFNAGKQDLIITCDPIEDVTYGDNVTITGNFTDKNGKAITKSNVNVYINGKQYKARTDSTGAFILTVPVKAIGTNNVTLSYGGNAYFNSFETNTTFNAGKQDVVITINKINNTAYGDNVTITGNFTDKNGKAISNSNVNVYINGKQYKARTDATGKYVLTAPVKAIGKNNVTVSYGGNNYYYSYVANKTFTATKQNVIITYDKISNVKKGKNVTITGKFTDKNGKAITNSNVNVYVNGKQYKARTDSTGAFKLSLKTNVVGTNNVTFSYGGNTYYNSYKTSTTFNVIVKVE